MNTYIYKNKDKLNFEKIRSKLCDALNFTIDSETNYSDDENEYELYEIEENDFYSTSKREIRLSKNISERIKISINESHHLRIWVWILCLIFFPIGIWFIIVWYLVIYVGLLFIDKSKNLLESIFL